jgi:hypothetical protein
MPNSASLAVSKSRKYIPTEGSFDNGFYENPTTKQKETMKKHLSSDNSDSFFFKIKTSKKKK